MNDLEPRRSMPARSDLYSPEPREHAWGLGESLASYLARLAEYHAVTVPSLVAYLYASATYDIPLAESVIYSAAGPASSQLNGMESVAQQFTILVATPTLRKGLEQMTLLPWCHLVTDLGLLHVCQHWCPLCLDLWLNSEQPPYWPLLWSLRPVTVCPIHHVALEDRCHHCQSAVQPVTARARIGFCPKCRGWLGAEGRLGPDDRAPTNSTGVTAEAVRLAAAARAMLAAAPLIQEGPTIHKLAGLVAECMKSSGCTQRALCQRLDTSYTQITHVIHRRQRMKVGTLLRLLGCMGLDIADFVREPITTLVLNQLESFIRSLHDAPPGVDPVRVIRGKRPAPDVLDKVQADLESALAQDYPPTIAALARWLSVHRSTLYKYFPHLCQAILEKRQLSYRSDEIRHFLIEAANTGVPPLTLDRIAEQLQTGTEALEKYFPDEVATIKARRAARDRTEVQKALEAFLEMEPPLSMAEVSRRLGRSKDYVWKHYPELYQAIVQRFADYRHTRSLERERQRMAAVREAVRELHSRGQFPTMSKVRGILNNSSRASLKPPEKKAYEEMMYELGLWQR